MDVGVELARSGEVLDARYRCAEWEGTGAGLMLVPGGQVVGMGLMSFGGDVIIQKATTGEVNWGEAALSGVAGLAGGGAGVLAGKVGAKVLTNPVIREGVVSAVDGAVSGSVDYMTGPGPHTPAGFLKNGAVSAATGGIPLGGAKGVNLPSSSTALARLGDEPPIPARPIPHVRGEGVWVASTDTVIVNSNRARTEATLDSSALAREPAQGAGMIYSYPDGATIKIMDASPGTKHDYDRAVFATSNQQTMDYATGQQVKPGVLQGADAKVYTIERSRYRFES